MTSSKPTTRLHRFSTALDQLGVNKVGESKEETAVDFSLESRFHEHGNELCKNTAGFECMQCNLTINIPMSFIDPNF